MSHQPITIRNGTDLVECITEYSYQDLQTNKRLAIVGNLIISIIVSLLIYWYYESFSSEGLFGENDTMETSAFFVLSMFVFFVAITFPFATYSSYQVSKKLRRIFEEGVKCTFETQAYEEESITVFNFFIPAKNIHSIGIETTNTIRKYVNKLMPDFQDMEKEIIIYPLINYKPQGTLENEIEKIFTDNLYAKAEILPRDILDKGKEITEVYLFIYVIENSIRFYIQRKAKEALGNNYYAHLNMSNRLRQKITTRKNNEQKNKWLSLRGSDDLFYLDFKELATVITENWNLFKNDFDSQAWVKTKIEEIANIRNLVAHNNSFIDRYNRDLLRLNYYQILKQMS